MPKRTLLCQAILIGFILPGAWAHAGQGGNSGRRPQSVLSMGRTSACAVLANGAVNCWGGNEFGQLGIGQKDTITHAPALVSGLTNVVSVGVQRLFACALTASGNVKCWGSNSGSWLGDGTITDHFTPVTVLGPAAGQTLTGAKSLSVGYSHACVVAANGSVLCWGANSAGQLGTNDTTRRALATTIYNPAGARFVEVAVGRSHSCALQSEGSVWCWGANDLNQLGNGSAVGSGTPVPVIAAANARSLAAAGDHTCVVRADGTPHCWGSNLHHELGQDGQPAQVKSIAAGWDSTCAVTADGKISCWGDNTYQSFGGQQPWSLPAPSPLPVSDVVALSAGRSSLCAANARGQVLCWGENWAGEAGDVKGRRREPSAPVTVPLTGPAMSATPMVSVGSYHSCALRDTGNNGQPDSRCWGLNTSAQVGDGTTTSPRLLPAPTQSMSGWPTAITSGNAFTCALEVNGSGQCWGQSSGGALGDGVLTPQAAPVAISGGLDGAALQLSGGYDFAVALLADGTARGWGANSYGQLGDGTTSSRTAPVKVLVAGAPLGNLTAVAAGGYHACFLQSSGSVWCSGYNGYGELGTGDTTSSQTPRATLPLAGKAVAISAGLYHTCALLDDGRLQCWGGNMSGPLGDGTVTNRLGPTSPADGCAHAVDSSGAALTASCNLVASQVCAADGYCCAGGWDSICVNEVLTVANQNPALGVNRAVALSGENSTSTCAILSTGSLTCWGGNGNGQLGIGTTTNSSFAYRATALTNTGSVATGQFTTCATKTDGTVWCWGGNGYGEVGDGTTTQRTLPVAVTAF